MLDLVPRLSIVMPVYNEGENIRLVLEAVQREVKTRPIEVLVVYDFDEDNTVPVVVGMQALFPEVRLVRNDLGRGVLNALRKGFQVARASDVLVMMADGSDEPQVVDRMVALAAAGADVVAGSRYVVVQSEGMRDLLESMVPEARGRTILLPPGIPVAPQRLVRTGGFPFKAAAPSVPTAVPQGQLPRRPRHWYCSLRCSTATGRSPMPASHGISAKRAG